MSKEQVMEPSGPAEPSDLHDLRIDVLRQAVAIYMRLAYGDDDPPEVVRRRLDWDPSHDAKALLSQPPFERAGKSKSTGTTIYALRLGNARYPHMKLQIQPWPNHAGFLLSVNTHDQVQAIDPASGDMPAFRALQAENQRLKEVIEQAWDDAGLPTFLRYLRDYISERSAGGQDRPPEPAGSPPVQP
ncbi:MAG: hypothetical protein LC745_07205 [Planctomycetia bacterium]|nr:hypothetical protein [Planctomycetia bacterium]